MRRSLLDRPPECAIAIDQLDAAADHLVAGRLTDAMESIAQADIELLRDWFIESQTPSSVFPRLGITVSKPDPSLRQSGIHGAADSRAVYERDGWHCRFCECKVIDPAARKRMVGLVPTLPWGLTNASRHAGILVHMASTDHVLPRSWGGTNDHSNLVTACWPCQFSRGEALIEECEIDDPFERPPIINDWDGLRRVLTVRVKK